MCIYVYMKIDRGKERELGRKGTRLETGFQCGLWGECPKPLGWSRAVLKARGHYSFPVFFSYFFFFLFMMIRDFFFKVVK